MPHNPARLQVVQRADELVVAIHAFATRHRRHLTDISPGLRGQLVRAAASVTLNLSEACGYHSTQRAIALLDVAIGSCNETERILRLCDRIGVHDSELITILEEIGGVRAMTYGFRRRLQRPQNAEKA
jgi:four helix bundle protein